MAVESQSFHIQKRLAQRFNDCMHVIDYYLYLVYTTLEKTK